MEPQDAREKARRLELALDLFAAGEDLFRQSLRRKHPTLSEDEIEAKVREWLRTRPGAEGGDAVGRIKRWHEIRDKTRAGPLEGRTRPL